MLFHVTTSAAVFIPLSTIIIDSMKKKNWLISFTFFLPHSTFSFIRCNITEDCIATLVEPGTSICENGFCTNPFELGCLKVMSEKYKTKNLTWIKNIEFDKIRICNSDDEGRNSTSSDSRLPCRKADWAEYFDMGEVRIGSSISLSSLYLSWIMQIVLTEILEVPTTLEHFVEDLLGTGSFYDRDLYYPHRFATETGLELSAIAQAYEVVDCRLTNEPCAHVLPDVSDYDIREDEFAEQILGRSF